MLSRAHNRKAWHLYRAIALNSLESFVVNTRVKLYEDLWEKSSTEEEREKIR
jgi:hypothetical protein